MWSRFIVKSSLVLILCIGWGCEETSNTRSSTISVVDMKTNYSSDLSTSNDFRDIDRNRLDLGLPISDAMVTQFDMLNDMEMDMEWTFDLAVDESAYTNVPMANDRLYAGYAQHSLGFPLGSAVVGFAPGRGVVTPFARAYPGTDTQHSELDVRVLLLRQGTESLVLVRTATIGVWQDFIVDLQLALRAQGRGDLADGLIIGATHSHASGGRIFNHRIGNIAVGPFLPEFYTRYRENILATILQADANQQPAQVGHATIQVPSIHSDRRCEDGRRTDDSMGLLKVSDDEGKTLAIMVNYAMHGTIVNNNQHVLSSDAPGAVEYGIEHRLLSYAPVLYFQSWAGDMAPESPAEYLTHEGHDIRSDYRDMDQIAAAAAEAVIPALDQIETRADAEIQIKTIRFPMSNDRINADGSFDQYPNGGLFCMPEDQNCGPDQRIFTSDDLRCIPIPADDTIRWGHISAARIGDLGLITLPGEPLTSVGQALRDGCIASTGLEQFWLLGYAQGYLAYLMHPDDFFLGGYEGQGTLLGPGLGVFLIERGIEIARHLIDNSSPLSFLPVPLPVVEQIEPVTLRHEIAQNEASWLDTPTMEEGIWTAEWYGGDPAIDFPVAHLQKWIILDEENGEWQDVVHRSGKIWSSRDAEIELSLRVDPSYEDSLTLETRTFIWRLRMPSIYSVMPSNGQLQGRYRWIVIGKRPENYTLESSAFDIGIDIP